MARRAKAVVVGAVVLMVAGACGDHTATPQPMNSAGSGVEAGQPGMPEPPDAGAGGSSAGGTGASGGAGVTSAAGAGEQPSEGGAPVVANKDVTGQVLAGEGPLAGAVVAVNGVVKIVDAEGRFQVRNVAARYQLMIRYPDMHAVFVYEGLTTREPLATFGQVSQEPRLATVRGKLVGGWGDPGPDDSNKHVSYVSQHPGYTSQDVVDPVNSFEVQPQWDGDASDDGELWAMQFLSDNDRGAYEYAGFGRKLLTVTDEAVLGSLDGDPVTDVTLVDPDDLAFETHIEVPPAWELDFGSAVYVGPLSMSVQLAAGDGSIVVPKLDVPVLVETSAYGDGGFSVVDVPVPKTGAKLDIVHPAPPQLTSPDADATGITPSTEFFWEGAPENSVASLIFSVGDWMIYVTTAQGSVTFPDLSPLHVRVPGQISGSWNVSFVGPAASVEEAMVRDARVSGGGKIAGFASTSDDRDFVTGP